MIFKNKHTEIINNKIIWYKLNMGNSFLAIIYYMLMWITFGGVCGFLFGVYNKYYIEYAALGAAISMLIAGVAELIALSCNNSFIVHIIKIRAEAKEAKKKNNGYRLF